MTVAQPIRRRGLISPTQSTSRSEPARRLELMEQEVRNHLLGSYAVRHTAEAALAELEAARAEASEPGWNGYDSRPISIAAYENAKLFLSALPSTAPAPEISVDSDGDVALDWVLAPRKALSVSIGPTGRCSFAWMRGQRSYRGTEWLDEGIPSTIAEALWRLARDASSAVGRRGQATQDARAFGRGNSVALYFKRHITPSINRPKPGAFSPEPYKELSVAHTTGLPHAEIWAIARLTLTTERRRDKVYARADVPVAELIRKKLTTIRDDDPFERHTLVKGWPDSTDPTERKELLKQITLELRQCLTVELSHLRN